MTLEKFKLLCWKNFTLQKRHWIAGLFEILFPILLVVIFTFGRSQSSTTEHKKHNYKSFQPKDYKYCYSVGNDFIKRIGVSPSDNLAIRALVESSVGERSKIPIEFYDNSTELNDFLIHENNTAGIEFEDDLAVSLRVNAELSEVIDISLPRPELVRTPKYPKIFDSPW